MLNIFNTIKSSLASIEVDGNTTITINGKTYRGNNVVISQDKVNGKIYIDDEMVDTCSHGIPLTINIDGDCKIVETASGDINCMNVSGNVSTASGDVKCANVSGNVTTASGDVECLEIKGSVRTVSGDVNVKK